MSVTEDQATLLAFFDYLFSNDQGYVVIATTRPPARRDTFKEQYFEWPDQKQELVDYVEKVTPSYNVYFCVNVLSVPKRLRENVIPQNLVWADLDACRPDQVDIPPQCVIESSPHRYQAIWRLDQKIDPLVAENYGKRLAYHHADLGADKSGWDATQLLRVPGTYNFKYQMDEAPEVGLLSMLEDLLPVDVFEALPQPASDDVEIPDLAIPELDQLPSPEQIIYRYKDGLQQTAFARYYSEEPNKDWSKSLWRLINTCIDVGMSAEETFVIAKNSKCNKYERDGRPDTHLWRDVLKGERQYKDIATILEDNRVLRMPALITSQEEDALTGTVIDDYLSWATGATDAVPIFHEVACTMLLSALMSTTLRLPTSNARVVPNLWALVLGDSTLTRKTTATDMAMDFLMEINKNMILSGDTSPEGLMHNLSLRPKMVSIFYRDEVTGFFDAIAHKEYLRSLPEIMTKMYDVPKYLPRTLRKETFVVSEPIFIFFGGGVPDKMYSLVDEEFFTSGFVPRFLIVEGRGNIENVRPTGPPQERGMGKRLELLQTFQALHTMYTDQSVVVKLPDGQQMQTTPDIEVMFPSTVWERAAEMETTLLRAAHDSPESGKALPTFSRMYVSMLKMTMLFAAARQEPTDYQVIANMDDLLNAAWYIQRWGKDVVNFISNSGTTGDETKLRSVYRTIERHPGIHRSQIMQRHRLNARETQLIEDTLLQRMQLQVTPKGRGKQYWPIGR
jgi:hypothetical protein